MNKKIFNPADKYRTSSRINVNYDAKTDAKTYNYSPFVEKELKRVRFANTINGVAKSFLDGTGDWLWFACIVAIWHWADWDITFLNFLSVAIASFVFFVLCKVIAHLLGATK